MACTIIVFNSFCVLLTKSVGGNFSTADDTYDRIAVRPSRNRYRSERVILTSQRTAEIQNVVFKARMSRLLRWLMFGSSALNTRDEGINDAYLGRCVAKETYTREVSTAKTSPRDE